MIRNLRKYLILLTMALAGVVACEHEDPIGTPGDEPVDDSTGMPDEKPEEKPEEKPLESGISNVYNQYADKEVSYYGATVSIKFDAVASWTAELDIKTSPEAEWVTINPNTQSGAAKTGATVRLVFDENRTSEERIADLWVTVEGFEPECIASLRQAASGVSSGAKLNLELNTYMHDILKEGYLFKDAYNSKEVDLTVDYNVFLNTHLLALGDVNVEDGGYRKQNQQNPGERYIYSNIEEVIDVKSAVAGGLGFGPFLSTALDSSSDPVMGITPGYVRRGSPVQKAGIRRGDIIYKVNGVTLNKNLYLDYMNTLYQAPSGVYQFEFLRDVGGEFKVFESEPVSSGVYDYDPVLYAEVIDELGIGYLVYESFDYASQELLEDAVNELKSAGMKELVLDLSFNMGGSVAQSRWLAGCIAGSANWSKTFANAVYSDGKVEKWTFDYGYDNNTDNLGLPIDLGLKRVYVICSYNTASAAELIISSLKGIGYDVRTIGSCTEGKNVGMTVSEKVIGGRKFQFSPVTFRLENAKGWSDYADGIIPDAVVNNDNGVIDDDYDYLFPYSFADWGDLEHMSAFQVAVLDIIGYTGEASLSAVRKKSMLPMNVQDMRLERGRHGNLVYNNN